MNKRKNLYCNIHSRPIEGYCQDCEDYICSSCMFTQGNPHKNHNLLSLDELAVCLRELIDKNIDLFRHDYSEKYLMEFIQIKKALESQREKLIQRINEDIDKLIKTINERREKIIEEIDNITNDEMKLIQNQENKWNKKVQIGKQILQIQINFDDENVYSNMKFILKGIKLLKEPIQQYEYKKLSEVQENINIDGNKFISVDELNSILMDMYTIDDENISNIPYKS